MDTGGGGTRFVIAKTLYRPSAQVVVITAAPIFLKICVQETLKRASYYAADMSFTTGHGFIS